MEAPFPHGGKIAAGDTRHTPPFPAAPAESVSLRNSFNNVPEFSSVGSGHVTRLSQSRSLGLRRWDILIAQAWITCPPLEPMCVRSSLLEPQEPRVGNCGFTRGIRAVGHKKSVLVKVSSVLLQATLTVSGRHNHILFLAPIGGRGGAQLHVAIQ